MSEKTSLAPNLVALQQKYGPRPLPLFLELVARECAGDLIQIDEVMQGLRRFEEADRQPARTAAPAVASKGRVKLRDFGGTGPPLVFVPSLINPPTVLDLADGHSLISAMRDAGFRALLVDWGYPKPGERDLDVSGHVRDHLVPLLGSLGEPPCVAGYCLGGTMAMAAASLMPVRALALIATPWNFDGFPLSAREDQTRLWLAARESADRLGQMPMEMLQSGFWQLDPARTVSKYARFRRLAADSEDHRLFIAVEDWANDGAPLTYAAARQLFESFIGNNDPGSGAWTIDNQIVGPDRIDCPLLDIVSTVDRIVPAATSCRTSNRLTLALGHVGMIVSRRAPERMWKPLAEFMSSAVRNGRPDR